MPTPHKDETQSEFVSRCISYVMKNEGIKDKKEAAGRCHGIWRSAKGQSEKKSSIEYKEAEG